MAYNRWVSLFNIRVSIQVILIAFTSLAFIWAFSKEYMLVTAYSLCLIWVCQIVYLIWYCGKVNRKLSLFFESFEYNDSTLIFTEKYSDKSFRNLYHSFNKITEAFRRARVEKQKEHLFFRNTIQHIGIGLIAFDENGKIRICNKAALRLFRLNQITYFSTLDLVDDRFTRLITAMKPNENELMKLLIDEEIIQLSIKKAEFVIDGERVQLVSFQDIKTEIEQNEMDSWQRLIRIFIHEIMNSVSPITLLTTSLINLINPEDGESPDKLTDEAKSDLVTGLGAIRKRSRGLAGFVETYRNLTQIRQPKFAPVKVKNMAKHVEILFHEELHEKKIRFLYDIQPVDIQITVDEKLIEQVLINLLRNSIHATENIDSPLIILQSFIHDNSVLIKIIDNGTGISKEQIDCIFTPFYTTKQAGSGIGLSLSRQIMRLHKGRILVYSQPGKETVFTLKF